MAWPWAQSVKSLSFQPNQMTSPHSWTFRLFLYSFLPSLLYCSTRILGRHTIFLLNAMGYMKSPSILM
jgi:hypothetical protein